jgi:hypothetical protein
MSWRFLDVTIAGFTGSGVSGRLHVATWTNSYIHTNSRYGWEASGSNYWNDTKVFNCYFFFNRLGGCLFAGGLTSPVAPSGYVYFTNCRFERSGQTYQNPMNNPADPAWVADAPGIRLSRAQYFFFTGCSTDANTGVGYDVLAVEAGASAWLNNISFTSCFANRDGGGAQTTLPAGTVSSGFRVQGFNSTDGNVPKEVHFVGCETATGGSSDTGGSTVISPRYGAVFQDAFFTDWIVGRPTGIDANMFWAGDTWGGAWMYNDAGVTKLRNRLGISAEIGTGAGTQTFWQDRTIGTPVAAQGLNLPAAVTELDATEQGSRQRLDPADLGIQVQVGATIRQIVTTGTQTITVSIREAGNTANILASVAVAITGAGTFAAKSDWAPRPAWFTGANTLLAVYTQGGNGANDYIFKNVVLRWKGGGA